MPLFVRRHPFLLLGLFTLSLFLGVEALTRTGHVEAAAAAGGPLRVLIMPMYVIWLLFTVVTVAVSGPDGLPGVVALLIWMCRLVAGLAPYALVDYLLARRRHAHAHRVAST